MAKKFESKKTLQQKIFTGVNLLADNVASTLGPKGRNVILHLKNSNPVITKDGVTVAKFIELEDPFENVGAQIVKQAATQTNMDAGDGTTTSTVLSRAILQEAQKYLAAGVPPIDIKRGIDKAVITIVEELKKQAIPIASKEDIEHIATISANGDKTIGKLIAKAIDLAGKDGAITIEEARSAETSLDVVEGFRLNSGYLAGAFINDEKRNAVIYENPLFLITDGKIESIDEIMPLLEIISREGRPFVIVAEDIEGQALAALIMNAVRGTLKVAAIKAPYYGRERRNILKDLAVSVGATYVTIESELKLKDVELQHLGVAKKIEILKNTTTIVDGKGDLEGVEKQIELLKNELEQTESLYECERIQERITRLASGIAIIRVGAATEIEMIEKKHRIEDALGAVKSAQEEGIVAGGGVAILRASKGLKIKTNNDDQQLGVNIVLEAVKEPIRQMARNAGDSPDLILAKVLRMRPENGWDFSTGKAVNMLNAGIVDPAKVVRCALQNAASTISILITTDHAIVEI